MSYQDVSELGPRWISITKWMSEQWGGGSVGYGLASLRVQAVNRYFWIGSVNEMSFESLIGN